MPNLRGYYMWGGGHLVPSPHKVPIRYKRFTMRELWANPGASGFTWSALDAELARAERDGQRLALRLRLMTGEGRAVPDWIVDAGLTFESVTLDTGKPITVPDLTKLALLLHVETFVHAVADRLAGRAAFVDIGLVGRWGEGHFWGIRGDGKIDGTKYWMPPVDVQEQIVGIHIAAFPQTQLLAMTDAEQMCRYALGRTDVALPIGWRRDSLGNATFDKPTGTYRDLLLARAKIAPVVTEFFGKETNVALAREQARFWNVWLVGNGNLGRAWAAFTPEEQAALLGIGEDAVARGVVAKPTDPVQALRDEITVLQRQVADLRQTVATNAELATSNLTRIVALEQQQFIAETTIKKI